MNQAEALARREQERRDRDAARLKADSERQKARNLAVQQARLPWDNGSLYAIEVGDRVCTFETNFIGDVEAINKDRIKVHVIAQVDTGSPGALFEPRGSIDVSRVELPRWFNRNDVAKCKWDQILKRPRSSYSLANVSTATTP